MYLKFCGIRDEAMLDFCLKNSIDFMGFNFVKSSQRKVENSFCNSIAKKINLYKKSKNEFQMVGVFMNTPLDKISKILDDLETTKEHSPFKLDILQFHGDESFASLQKIKQKYPEKKIWKAFSLKKNLDPKKVLELIADFSGIVDLFLFDGSTPGAGKEIQDQKNLEILLNFCTAKKIKYGIAGGINLANIQKMKQNFKNAYLLDIASGIEIEKKFNAQKAQKIIEIMKKN